MRSSSFGVTAVALAALCALGAQPSSAQTGFAIRGGSTGIGLEVAHQIKPWVSVRAGGTYFALTGREFTLENEDVDIGFSIDAKGSSFFVLADLMPLGNFIHLSTGLVYNALSIDALGEPLTDYQLENRTFTKSTLGSLSVSLDYANKIAPYVGIGFGNVATGGRIGITLDAGVIFSGALTVNLLGTGMLEPTAEQDSVVQEALDGVRIYPLISLGLVIRP